MNPDECHGKDGLCLCCKILVLKDVIRYIKNVKELSNLRYELAAEIGRTKHELMEHD